jgi:hypothetical protein
MSLKCYQCLKEQEQTMKTAVGETLSNLYNHIPDKMHRIVWIIGDDGFPISTQYGDAVYYLTQGIHMKVYDTYDECLIACALPIN